MDFLRCLEIVLYALLRIAPFLFLMVYTFRDKFRFSDRVTWILLGVIVLARIACALFAYLDESRINDSNPGFLVYVALTILLVKDNFGKSLFTMLMLINVSTFTVMASKSFENLFFPELAVELHRYTNSITLLVVEGIILTPLFFYIKKIHMRALKQSVSKTVWHYLWCIPMTFYVVGYRDLFMAEETFHELSLKLSYTFYCFLLTAGGALIYTIVANLISEYAKNNILNEKIHIAELQESQYQRLQDRITEARRATHDIRKHIYVMSTYLRNKKYDEAETYLGKYRASLPEEVTLSFCENSAVNALLQYFSGYAKMVGAGFSSTVAIPNDCGVPDDVLTVVLGNLLENTMEYCASHGSGAVISVRSKIDDSAVFFKVINTCLEKPKTDREGNFLSSKRKEGTGIGLDSVNKLAKEYNGMMKAYWEDGMFIASVMLCKKV